MWKYLILICSLSISTHGEIYNLEKIKKAAHQHNFGLNAARSEKDYFELEKKEKRSNFLPRIGLEAGIERSRAKNIRTKENTRAVYSEVNLFNGFKDSNDLEKSKLRNRLADRKLAEVDSKLNLQLESLFYKYIFLYQKDVNHEASQKRNISHLKLIEKRLSSSLVTETDLLEFKLKKSKLAAEHSSLELAIEETKYLLLKLAGIKDTNVELNGELPHYLIDESLEDLVKSISTSSNELALQDFKVTQNTLDLKAHSAEWMPKVDFSAKYGRLAEDDTDIRSDTNSTSFELIAKWELFSGFATTNKRKKTAALKLKNEYLFKQKKLELEALIRSQYLKIKSLEKRIVAEERNHILAKKLYKSVKKEFQRGIRGSDDLARASDEFSKTSLQVFELKKKYIDSKIKLESALSRSISFKQIKH